MSEGKINRKACAWILDVALFVLMFFGLAASIFLVNIITSTWNQMSGHALATILSALMLLRYRWHHPVPDHITVLAFSAIAGISATVYLYSLQWVAEVGQWFSFEPIQGNELVIAFVANTLVFAATAWLRKRTVSKQQ